MSWAGIGLFVIDYFMHHISCGHILSRVQKWTATPRGDGKFLRNITQNVFGARGQSVLIRLAWSPHGIKPSSPGANANAERGFKANG